MTTALDELFLAKTMTTTVKRFADQADDRSFLAPYEAGEKILPISDSFSWDEVSFSRDLASVTGASSPTKGGKRPGVVRRNGEVYGIKEHADLDVRFIMMARGTGSLMPNPEEALNNVLLNLTNKVMRTKNYWAALSYLAAGGSVDLGAFPNADLPAGAVTLVYPIQQISVTGGPWSNPATKIRSVASGPIRKTYRQASGLRAKVAIGSSTMEGYLTGNEEFTDFLRGGSLSARKAETSFEDGDTPRYAGFDWKFADDFYAPDVAAGTDDTPQDIIGDPDLVAVLPDPSKWQECFATAEGRHFIATGLLSSLSTGGNPFNTFQEFRGLASWITLENSGTTLRAHVAWIGNFVQKVRKAVCRLNTTP